ncbi:MAG: hypothetical protein M3P18_11845, partial [Actinomycetota bacterium]|nr:hypothetical protein [Actinomycetota bacterium]
SSSQQFIKPSSYTFGSHGIYLRADGLVWQGWGSPTAKATGRFIEPGASYTATVVVSHPQTCMSARYYTHIVVIQPRQAGQVAPFDIFTPCTRPTQTITETTTQAPTTTPATPSVMSQCGTLSGLGRGNATNVGQITARSMTCATARSIVQTYYKHPGSVPGYFCHAPGPGDQEECDAGSASVRWSAG